MKMKKLCCVVLSCLILSGCGYQYERNRDREEAKTLQQKRDVLLKWSPFEIKNRSPDDPYNIYDARKRYIGNGEESDSFLTGMISSCYSSLSDECAYNYYVAAYNKDWNKVKKKQSEIADSYNNKIIKERTQKIPVKKGDLFYCKVAINPAKNLVDSGLRAGVKDNINNFGVIFSNDNQIVSPELKVTDSASGLRTATSVNGTETFIAEYDGASYVITTYNKYEVTKILGGRYIYKYDYVDDAVRFQMYDCKKS